MSKPMAENQKPDADAYRGQTGQCAARSAGRGSRKAAKMQLLPCFRGRMGVAVHVLWARVCPLAPPFPGAYIYALEFSEQKICNVLG